MDRSLIWRIFALVLAVALLAACGGAASGGAAASTSPDQLKALTTHLDDAVAKLKNNDVAGAKDSFKKFDDGWATVEDGVKAKNKDGYAKIESGITDVKAALTVPATVDTRKAIDALEKLDSTVDDVVPTLK
jgi:hypothetical protein